MMPYRSRHALAALPNDAPVPVSVNDRMRKLKSVLAAAIARKLDGDPAALYLADSKLRLKQAELNWLLAQQIDLFTMGRLVQIALALGCDVSLSVAQSWPSQPS